GEFRQHPPEQAYMSVIALCIHTFAARKILEIVFPEVLNRPNFYSERYKYILDLLFNGLLIKTDDRIPA
ncbi:MAG: hypothetical protein ABH878_03950, partial [bacterium]